MSENERLREALRFYADRRHHSGVGVSRVYNDNGRLAQEALGEPCKPCYRSGWVEDDLTRRAVPCRVCNGKGYVEAT